MWWPFPLYLSSYYFPEAHISLHFTLRVSILNYTNNLRWSSLKVFQQIESLISILSAYLSVWLEVLNLFPFLFSCYWVPKLFFNLSNCSRIHPLFYQIGLLILCLKWLQIATVEVPEEHMGAVVELLGKRRGQMFDMEGVGCVYVYFCSF